MSFKVGQRVEVSGKDCQGAIAYVGYPHFASGKWIGVILDEPKGKNNGTIKGAAYFKCADNHGMFVRQSQLILIDDAGNKIEPSSPAAGSRESTGSVEESAPARARSRLNTSRLSLAGSRTQLTAPSTENLSTSQYEKKEVESHIPVPSSIPKRSSFVETGFVETLKPQFVPGQAILNQSTSHMEEKLSNLQLAQENENMKSQIHDLTEKVEVLRAKRLQDKERMKDFEKTKLQLEQLLEFKAKVMESQASLQRDLQRAKQETRDAHIARERFQEDMTDLMETVEMATLDKEMAEEKAETLQLELEQLQEKVEELTTDLELLKSEMSDKTKDTSTGTTSTYEYKQLEQQNARLRETLVKLRDLSAHEKHEFQKLQKDLDQKKSEISELGRTKEKLSATVEEMEHQIADLQEQVDAALGAEEMVESLSEKKMMLEEKVAELEEAVRDLEALQDMSDQLAESQKELETELREEVDISMAKARDAQQDREAALETLADRELTIVKFRELTQQLQLQCVSLQERLQTYESSMNSSRGTEQQLADILDFQKTFAETKAQTKAVDLELRRLEAEEARNHVNYLMSFMPPAFMARGGDHDAILTLLLIPRMIQKTEIVISQVRDKYKTIDKRDRISVVKDHSIAQYSFRCTLCFHMYALQTALSCFESALNYCSPETLLSVGSSYPEMVAQEKSLDQLIELAKKDQLDENLSMDSIEKCSTYFINMYCVLFGESDLTNQARLVVNGTKMLESACEAMLNDAAAVKTLVDGDSGEIGLLCQHIETCADTIQQCLKSARRKVPREHLASLSPHSSFLGLNKDWPEQFSTCYQNAFKVAKTIQDVLKNSVQVMTIGGDLDKGIDIEKLKDIATLSSEKIYDTDDLGPVVSIKASLATIHQAAVNLTQKMTECENELVITGKPSKEQQAVRESSESQNNPILLRAQVTRKESEEVKILNRKLEVKESDIRESKLLLREKQEELSEMALRKELMEKRLTTQQQDYEMQIEKLKRKVDETQNLLKRKEKEFEETMDHFQTDLDNLTTEKGQLKEKLKTYSKKVTPSISNIDDLSTASANRLLIQELTSWREALVNERREKMKLLYEKIGRTFESLEPLPLISNNKLDGNKIVTLNNKYRQIQEEIVHLTKVPDLTLKQPKRIQEKLKYQQKMQLIQERINNLQNEIRDVKMKRLGFESSNFRTFYAPEMQTQNDKTEMRAGEINIPCTGAGDSCRVHVGLSELKKIHSLLNY